MVSVAKRSLIDERERIVGMRDGTREIRSTIIISFARILHLTPFLPPTPSTLSSPIVYKFTFAHTYLWKKKAKRRRRTQHL